MRGLSGLYRGAYGTVQFSPPGVTALAKAALVATGIGASAIRLVSNISRGAIFDFTNANGGYFVMRRSGNDIAYIGNSAAVVGSGTLDNTCIDATGARGLDLATNDVIRLAISSAGLVTAPSQIASASLPAVYVGPFNQITADATFVNTTLANTGMPSVTVVVGTYAFSAYVLIYEATAGTGGAKFDFGGGTATVSSTLWAYTGNVNAATVSSSANNSSTTAAAFATVTTTATAPNVVYVSGTVTFSVAGTFAMRGAQNSLLAADATHFVAGSYLELTRIS